MLTLPWIDRPLDFQRLIKFAIFFNLCLKFSSTNIFTSYVMKMHKNLTHVFHLNPARGSSSQFWRDPIHMASVFITFSIKPDTFSKSLNSLSKAWAEFKSAKMAVVSSANWSNLVSESLIITYFNPFNIFIISYRNSQYLYTNYKEIRREGISLSNPTLNIKIVGA